MAGEIIALAAVVLAYIIALFNAEVDWQLQNATWAFRVFLALWIVWVIGRPVASALRETMLWVLNTV